MGKHPLGHDIRAVLFDFDGTLTQTGAIDFVAIRSAIGCPRDQLILEYIKGLTNPDDQASATATLKAAEWEAAARSTPMVAAESTVRTLIAGGVPVGLLTRNCRSSIDRSLSNFAELTENDFSPIITRETPVPPKPAPDGIFHAAAGWGLSPAQIMMVGDFHLDVAAGHAAGAVTVLLVPDPPARPRDPAPAYEIARLDEILPLVGMHCD